MGVNNRVVCRVLAAVILVLATAAGCDARVSLGRVRNFRDAGGWEMVSGGHVPTGRIYRSGSLDCIPSDSARELTGRIGIKTDLDLREREKCKVAGRSTLGDGVRWINVPSQAYEAINTPDGKKAFREAFGILVREENYPVVVHCRAGRDRTGTFIFIVNGLCGD